MTTRPVKFGNMLAILSTYACRCDEPADIAAGKARFRLPAWVVWFALRRRVLAKLLGAVSFLLMAYWLRS